MTTNSIPQPAQPIAGGQRVDATWYRWLRELDRIARASDASFSAEVAAIARRLGSPDGTIEGIPEAQAQQLVGIAPVTVDGVSVGLQTVTQAETGDLVGISVDGFGRIIGTRPVVAGAGVTIDGTTNPAQIEIRSTVTESTVTNRITTNGDFRRTTQNDLRITA